MLTTVRCTLQFGRFVQILLARGELNTATLQQIMALEHEIVAITNRDNLDDLLDIVVCMADEGPGMLSRLSVTTTPPASPWSWHVADLLRLFNAFLRGSRLQAQHLHRFLREEAAVLHIANYWKSQEILQVVWAVSQQTSTAVKEQLHVR